MTLSCSGGNKDSNAGIAHYRNTFWLVVMSWRVDGKLHLESILKVLSSTLLDS